MRSKVLKGLYGLIALLALLFTIGATANAATIPTTGLNGSNATVKDRYGKVVTDTTTMSKWENYDISYNWSIPDNQVIKAGDTASVALPAGSVAGSDLSVPLVDSDGKTIGTFTIKAGETTGTITFNDALTNTSVNRKGTLNFYGKGTATGDVHFNWNVNKVGWVAERDPNGRPTQVTWNVAFNPTGQNVGTVVVTDTLGPNQTFLPGTVIAQTGEYSQDGYFHGKGQIIPEVTQAGNKITFTFTNVTTAVNLVYNTKLAKVSDSGEVVNSANMNGTTVGGQVTWGGSGTGQGDQYKGTVQLTKTDAKTGKALAGAVFKLLDNDGNVVKENLTTDANGELTVDGLAAGQYKFIETKAPDGYTIDTEPIHFAIVSGSTATVEVSATDVESETEPSEPGTPTEPGEPGEPGTPTEPGEPGTPTEPGEPGEPGTPTEPGEPSEPGTPTEPGEPSEPGTPTEPGKPSEPGTPTEPGKPGEPGTPTVPSEPGESDTPVEPEKPTTPGTTAPTKPVQPTQPVKPSESAQAGKPSTSTGSTTTGQTVAPNTTTGMPANGVTTNGVTTGHNNTNTPAANGTTGRLPQTDETGTHPIIAILEIIFLIILGGLAYWNRRRI